MRTKRTGIAGYNGHIEQTLKSWSPKLAQLDQQVSDLYNEMYDDKERPTNKLFFGKRVYRKVVEITPLPDSSSKSVPHGITNIGHFTHIEGIGFKEAIDDTFTMESGSNMGLWAARIRADSINIYVNTTVNYSTYSNHRAWVTLEYTKEGQ